MQGLTLVINDTHLTVTWDPPLMPNGPGIVRYSVTLSGINLVNSQAIEIDFSSVNVTQTIYSTLHSPLPYSNYTAVVTAFTSAGFGLESTFTVQTPEAGMLPIHNTNC